MKETEAKEEYDMCQALREWVKRERTSKFRGTFPFFYSHNL